MKNFKKVLSVVLVFALVFTSMMTFSATTTEAKVKSIKTKKKVTVYVGKSKKVKVKVKATGKTSKKFTAKSSNKKVATVKVKKKKVIIKGKKAGKCKVTIRSKANKKKKKVIKVTVKSTDATMSVSSAYSDTFLLKFSKKVNFKQNQLTIKAKTNKSGSYIATEKVWDVSTDDNQNYVVETDRSISNGTWLQFVVSGVNKSNIVKELEVYNASKRRITSEVVVLRTNEEYTDRFEYEDYVEGSYGRLKSASGIPSGISRTSKEDAVILKGKIAKAGVYYAKLNFENDKGTVYTHNITYVVGSDKQLTVYAPKEVGSVYNNGSISKVFSDESRIYISGGSGSYSVSVTDWAGIFTDYPYGGGNYYYWEFSTEKAGTYNGKITVTDNNDSSIKANATVTVQAKNAVVLSGKVTSNSGKAISNAYVTANVATNQDEDLPYHYYEYTDNNGKYTIILPTGQYDLRCSCSKATKNYFNRKISGNTTFNFKLNLYQIIFKSNNASVKPSYFDDWLDANGEYVGFGEKVFLKPGSYNLTTTGFAFPATFKANARFSVSRDATVTASVSFVNVPTINEGTTRVTIMDSSKYWKFVPTKSGEYFFESSNNTGDPHAVLYNSDGTTLDEDDDSGVDLNFYMQANLTAGQTYYLCIGDYDGENKADIQIGTLN